jgi:hypothetical protein
LVHGMILPKLPEFFHSQCRMPAYFFHTGQPFMELAHGLVFLLIYSL